MPVGYRLPGEDEIVSYYKVSRTTVRQAVESLVNEGLVSKQQGKGTFVIANKPKRLQKLQTTNSIAFLLPDLTQQFPRNIAASVVSKVESYLRERNFNLVLAQSNYSIENESNYLQLLSQENAGIIWLPEDEDRRFPSHYSFQLVSDGYPLLLYDKTIKGLDSGYVISENYFGVVSLVEHLISLGHQFIAFYGALTNRPTSVEDRLNGYLHTLAKNNLEINYNWIFPEEDEGLKNLFKTITTKKTTQIPTAVICKDDIDALKVLDKAYKLGINIPEELSVTGFDHLGLGLYNFDLTTVQQDHTRLGVTLAEQMVTAINNSLPLTKIVLPTKLIIGNTTSSPKTLSKDT